MTAFLSRTRDQISARLEEANGLSANCSDTVRFTEL